MNKRDSDILNDIISGGNKGIPFFARKYHVSERTIRNDLKVIDGILRTNQLPSLTIRTNGAIVYYGEKKPVVDLVKSNDFYAYKLSKEERKIAFSLILLLSDRFVTLNGVSEKLFVSRTTLINDLNPVKQFLRSHGLKVESHPNKGIRLLGSERRRRQCIIDIILTKLGLSGTESEQYSPFYNMILNLIDRNEYDKKTIEQIIKTEEKKNGLRFTDSAFITLVYCLIVSVGRMLTGNFVEEGEHPGNGNYALAKDLLAYTTDYFHLPLRESEIHLLSDVLTNLSPVRGGCGKENSMEIQVIATKFIRNISKDLGIDLTPDFTFYESLEKHLQATLLNRFASLPQTSVTDLIIRNYPSVMRVTKKEAVILENCVHHKISENELTYLAMHVCAAIERKHGNRKKTKIIVVCGGGIGTSELLIERLKKRFNFDITAVMAAHNADTLQDKNADLVISTVPLKNCGIDFLQVSPFLNDEDYLKICRYLDSVHPSRTGAASGKRRLTSDGLMKKLQPIFTELIPQHDISAAISLRARKAAMEYFGENAEHGDAALCQLLTPDKILLDAECSCREDAIRQSAEILLRQDYISPRYIEAIFQNMRENGPYFVLSPGFAVPHAGLGNGSKKMGMSLLRLKYPVPFGNQEFDPVEFVCCLSAVDSDSHLKAFFNLVNLLRMEDFKKELHTAATPKEAADIICVYESDTMSNSERS